MIFGTELGALVGHTVGKFEELDPTNGLPLSPDKGRIPTRDDIGKKFLLRAGGGEILSARVDEFSPSGKYVSICPVGWFVPLHVEILEEMPNPPE
jgi:hypothetical protein